MQEEDYGIVASLTPQTLQAIDSAMLEFVSPYPRRDIAIVRYMLEESGAAIPWLPDWFFLDRVAELIDGHAMVAVIKGEDLRFDVVRAASELVKSQEAGVGPKEALRSRASGSGDTSVRTELEHHCRKSRLHIVDDYRRHAQVEPVWPRHIAADLKRVEAVQVLAELVGIPSRPYQITSRITALGIPIPQPCAIDECGADIL